MMLSRRFRGSIVSHPLRQCRRYATAKPEKPEREGENNDPELVSLLHSYPDSKEASPYEVLGLKSSRELQHSSLKKRFHQLARIYHPDSTAFDGISLAKKSFFTTNAEGSESGQLTPQVKSQRFKRILAAYTLLRNPLARSNYDEYQVGWNDGSPKGSQAADPNFHNPNSPFYQNMGYRQRRRPHSNTGTWEDYWDQHNSSSAYGFHPDESWKGTEQDSFSEQLWNNRRNIFISASLFLATYAALQATHRYLYEDFEGARTYSSDQEQEQSEQSLLDARTNFGLGLTKEDRINRFLWFRRVSMLLSLGDMGDIMDYLHGRKVLRKDESTGRYKLCEFENDRLMEKRREAAERNAEARKEKERRIDEEERREREERMERKRSELRVERSERSRETQPQDHVHM